LEKMEVRTKQELRDPDMDDETEYVSIEKATNKRGQRTAPTVLQLPPHVEINAHSTVDTSKKEMIARIAALRLHCASLEKQVAKYKESKGFFSWCTVGINLTRWVYVHVHVQKHACACLVRI
jgi:hypothetical protein